MTQQDTFLKKIIDIHLTEFQFRFPGEGKPEFVNTKKILADLPISYFHVFTYSDRPGTSSIKMKDKVDFHDKKERNRILIEQGKRKKLKKAN